MYKYNPWKYLFFCHGLEMSDKAKRAFRCMWTNRFLKFFLVIRFALCTALSDVMLLYSIPWSCVFKQPTG